MTRVESDPKLTKAAAETTPADAGSAAPSLPPEKAPLPHERDQGKSKTSGGIDEKGKQAHEDVEAGRVDTSRGREAQETYQKQK